MPCNPCFLCDFLRRYRKCWSLDHMTSSNLIFDGGRGSARSTNAKFCNQYFLHKTHNISSGFQICHSFSSSMSRTPKIAVKIVIKMSCTFFILYILCYKNVKNRDTFLNYVMCVVHT